MLEKKNRVEFIRQARAWLDTYGNMTIEAVGKRGKPIRTPGQGQVITVFKNTDYYQGVALELAKMELAIADDSSVKKKLQDELRADALKVLQEASKIPCGFQRECALLLRKLQGKGPR